MDPSDVRDLEKDPLLKDIESILGTNIGPPYSYSRLREVVEEAVGFRFPNKIPPGYEDSDKPTGVAAAGDYILWRQLIDHVIGTRKEWGRVILVTGDLKQDWWALAADGKPLGPRPELIYEFEHETGVRLLLLSTPAFLEGANRHLRGSVSQDTLSEVEALAYEKSVADVLRRVAGPDAAVRFSRGLDVNRYAITDGSHEIAVEPIYVPEGKLEAKEAVKALLRAWGADVDAVVIVTNAEKVTPDATRRISRSTSPPAVLVQWQPTDGAPLIGQAVDGVRARLRTNAT